MEGSSTASRLATSVPGTEDSVIDMSAPMYSDFDKQSVLHATDKRPIDERSTKHLLVTILFGRATPFPLIFLSVAWSALAVLASWALRRDYDDGACRWWCSPLRVEGTALSYVGFALFLLTSFRVSEAYSRYMQAVAAWTAISGTTTSFAKYVCEAFPPGMIHQGDTERILAFLVAFPVALKRELRGERDLRELKTVLATEDLAQIQNADSMSSYCLFVLSGYMLKAKEDQAHFPSSFLTFLIGWIADLGGAAGTCNQIKTMPAPYSYIAHLNVFLGLWLFFLPFALVEDMGWLSIVLVAFISYGILGILSNAKDLENPFGFDLNDLPLGKMAQDIQDQVEDIYRTCKSGSKSFVHTVKVDNLRGNPDYWLAKAKQEKKA